MGDSPTKTKVYRCLLLTSRQKCVTDLPMAELIDLVNDAARDGDFIVKVPCFATDPWLPLPELETWGIPVSNIDLICDIAHGGEDVSKQPSGLLVPKAQMAQPTDLQIRG